MGLTVQNVLVTALKKLGKRKFKRFKEHLSEWEVSEGYIKITKDQLDGKDPDHVADLIRRHYTDSYGIYVTLAILKAIQENKIREDLKRDFEKVHCSSKTNIMMSPTLQDKCIYLTAKFMDEHRTDLIRRITMVDPVLYDLWEQGRLTQEQYKDLIEKPTSLEKMRGLWETISYWDDIGKDMAYRALRRHNSSVINYLESDEWKERLQRSQYSISPAREHYVEKYCLYLEREITDVDPLLDELLDQKLLTLKQYERVKTNKRSRDRMRVLCIMFIYGDDIDKDLFYLTLRKHNYAAIRRMERGEIEHFVDIFRSDLIEKITVIDPVLDDLLKEKLLTQEQYNDLIKKATSEDKMRDLYEMIRFWHYTDRDTFYLTLRTHNYVIIRDLESHKVLSEDRNLTSYTGANLLRNHQSELIRRMIMVEPVLDDLLEQKLLTQEQYNDFCKKTTSEDKMRDLCDIVRSWSDPDKEIVCMTLRRYNTWVTRNLESEDQNPVNIFNPSFSNQFVNRHRSDIIRMIIMIDPVLDDLKEMRLLTKEQYNDLCKKTTYEDKTRELCDIVRDWGDVDKDTFCMMLKKYNSPVICDLEIMEIMDKIIRPQILLAKPSDRTFSSPPLCSESEEGQMDCKLCGLVQDSSNAITPIITGSTYRLELNSPGLFCCSETGIKFQVTYPVTIEYELDSWGNYVTLIQNQTKGYEIIGPLFNIKSNIEPGAVSAVYLPHCLCLKGFDIEPSWIKCFHMKDKNMVLETPTRIEPYYVVLEHPTFSCIGVLMYHWNLLQDEIIKHIPFHGKVLLYCKIIGINNPEYKEYRIHLYLTPSYISMEKAVHNQETIDGYYRMRKPPQTDCVYTKKNYNVKGPESACVVPETLLFHCSYPSEPYPFTEITIDGNDTITNIDLYLLPEECGSPIWKAKLTKGDITDIKSPKQGPTVPEAEPMNHFVDIHRLNLISMISTVDPVLDDLLDQGLLTDEQYDTIRLSKPTSQEKMRELYSHVRSWGNEDKDAFYQALMRYNAPVIRKLKTGRVKCVKSSDTSTNTFRCTLV
ncbi:uncharacterized protein LOC142097224 isoform X2 [Mixophyes fleayi]|uniref:uncharacterized protein LOC142097224 isoform X2 n=1 Tax=Mixophyes fleayi TaxID=3061075 RepID=UPI003F4DBD18